MPVVFQAPAVRRSSWRWGLAGAILVVVLALVLVARPRDAAAPRPAPAPAATVALDLSEPTPPAIECAFEPLVFCVGGHTSPTCPASEAALVDSVYPTTEAQVSPSATLARRAVDPTACCYVQYHAVACD